MNHIILSNCCSSHTLHPSIHTYCRRIREQCHLPPVTSHDPSSAQLHRFRIDSTSTAHRKLPYSAPGLPLPKPRATIHHSNRTKWQTVVLGRDRRYPKQHTQHGDTSSFTALLIKNQVFWHTTPCRLITDVLGTLLSPSSGPCLLLLGLQPWRWRQLSPTKLR